MRIAIDGTTLLGRDGGPGAGVEEYTRRLTAAIVEQDSSVRVIRPLGRVPFVSRHLSVSLQALLARVDVLFCPAGHIPFGWFGRSVIVVHDLAIHEHPEWFPQGASRQDAPSIRRAEKIIAVSEATRQQIGRLFPEALGKTIVVYPGIVPTARRTTHTHLPTDQVLFVGTVEPRKNLANAVAAFDAFLRMHPERATTARLVVAGRLGWKAEPVVAAVARTNAAWRQAAGGEVIQMRGYVSDEEKSKLYAESACLFFPSLYEGFGLPVLEAMSAGLPVVTSNRGALPEVGGDSVMYAEPDDVEQMAFALAQCLLLPEAMGPMVEEARERAARFRWPLAAEEILRALGDP